MGKLSSEQVHKNMAAIRSKDTKPEMIVRKGLWKRGFRYRLNHERLPGHPDLVLRKYRTCIFINGCFWHGHLVYLKEIMVFFWRCGKFSVLLQQKKRYLVFVTRHHSKKVGQRFFEVRLFCYFCCKILKKQGTILKTIRR